MIARKRFRPRFPRRFSSPLAFAPFPPFTLETLTVTRARGPLSRRAILSFHSGNSTHGHVLYLQTSTTTQQPFFRLRLRKNPSRKKSYFLFYTICSFFFSARIHPRLLHFSFKDSSKIRQNFLGQESSTIFPTETPYRHTTPQPPMFSPPTTANLRNYHRNKNSRLGSKPTSAHVLP